MVFKIDSQRGNTLVELLLYIGISSTILLISTLFLQMVLESRIKNQTIAEVEHQGLLVMQTITQVVRNGINIVTPEVGTNGEVLILDVVGAGNSPTQFTLSEGVISVTEGSGLPIALTNSRVTASSLSFQNLSRKNTPGIVRISFVLTHVNSEGRQEYDFSKTFYASASLR